MKIIDNELLDAVSAQAKLDPRLRKNYNLHKSLEDTVQKLLNALEPDTVIPIHRHKHTNETYILLRGKLDVLLYNDNKEITETIELDPLKGKFGVSIPEGQWHSVVVKEEHTVIFEVKEGPYAPLHIDDIM